MCVYIALLGNCPKSCSARGSCYSMQDLAIYFGQDYDPAAYISGDGVGPVYSNWDASSIMACNCELGYFGPDCSLG